MRQICDSLGERDAYIPLYVCAPVSLNLADVHRQDLRGVPRDLWMHKLLRSDFLIFLSYL